MRKSDCYKHINSRKMRRWKVRSTWYVLAVIAAMFKIRAVELDYAPLMPIEFVEIQIVCTGD